MVKKEANHQELIDSLSLNERKIIPFLEEDFKKICEKSALEEVAVLRSLEFLSNKNILELKITQKKIIDLGINGILYKQKGLPERRLINLIADKKEISLKEAEKQAGLNENEFQAALGALKKRAMINMMNGNIILSAEKSEIVQKSLEEKFIEALPIELDKLAPEQKFSMEKLKSRKNILEVTNKNEVEFKLTPLGKELISSDIKFEKDLIEQLTPEIISKESWRGKKFRRYDVTSPVPKISGGKRHFVNQSLDYARTVWSELGFKEMTGNMCQTGFWNFDALFTAQDHPVREMQDTFYLKDIEGTLPDKKLVDKVKKAHESGADGSSGWGGKWQEKPAKRVLLRTHTTCISVPVLTNLKKQDLPAKFFAIGKCFRNETVDWSHGFEFNQTEGIVIDKNANFRNLLGYLKEFYIKMGYPEVKFIPSYFPYTEPSVEIYAFNKEKQVWIEVGGAGIFRPEVVVPLLGEYVPVLAWGPGFDRAMMGYYGIADLRELYKNNLELLKKIKFWMK